jgi:Tol biopolymer transport system component
MTDLVKEDRSMRNTHQKIMSLGLLFLIPWFATQQSAPSSAPYSSTRPLPEPVIFGEEIISTGDMDLNAAFTPDGQTLYFTKRTPKLQFWVIVVSHFQRGRWSAPEVAEFSGQYSDFDPFISPDGSKLFFCSTRPSTGQPKSDFDIWVVEKKGTGWSAPLPLAEPVNTRAQEYYPSVASNGTLYFSSSREGGKGRNDIYRARWVDGKYADPENLGEAINSQYPEGDPYIAPDESYLVFVSYGRPEGFGDGDLYISFRRDGAWTKAVNLGPKINSSALDFCPIVSPDGKYFFFTSERGFADQPLQTRLSYAQFAKRIHGPRNGLGDIYQADISVLNLNREAR